MPGFIQTRSGPERALCLAGLHRRAPRLALKAAAAVLVALTAANCAGPQVTGRKGPDNKYGVKASPRVIAEGDPVPKGGGRDMIGKPYIVGGRIYVPTNGKGYSREGWASWYGTAFHGRLTANGEIFDRQSIAAAHPTLPLPSYVRVTNVVNKRSMVVRVNDRGPYEYDRVIDVSERVADALDFRRKGTTRVSVEYLGKASTRGSDDEKLLATLRLDGSPAPFGSGRGPVQYADLRTDPAPRPAPPRMEVAETRPAMAPAMAEPDTEDAEPMPAPRPTPVRVAAQQPSSAEEDDSDDAVPLPPMRPVEPRRMADATLMPVRTVAPPPAALLPLLPTQRPTLAGIY